jgi:cell wall-associated NlpC family hydrolase
MKLNRISIMAGVFILLSSFVNAELINKYTIAEQTPSPVAAKAKKQKKLTKRQVIINAAKSLIGLDYWPGGQDSDYGYDCSGLTQFCYNAAGIDIPRVSRDQYTSCEKVDESELKPGDLIFFNTLGNGVNHVGIYLGSGDFIHAPGIGHQIRTDTINKPYWRVRFFGGGRFLK